MPLTCFKQYNNTPFQKVIFDFSTKVGSPVWPDGQISFSIFGHLQQWNIPNSDQFVTVGSQFAQYLNKHSNNCQKREQSGKISLNLVTLLARNYVDGCSR